MTTLMTIARLTTDYLRVPLSRAVSLPASQDPRAAKTADVVVVQVQTQNGPTGLGFTYSLGGGGEAIRSLLDNMIAPMLVGEDPTRTEWLFARATAELESVGFGGLAARAYAAVDFALWDIKGKLGNLPVHKLLGGYRSKVKAVVTDTATPALGVKQAVKETRAALEQGAAGVCVEIGTQDPELDAERVRQMREAVPQGAWFEVSGCGRYDYSTALALGRLFEEEFAIDGFSDPLRPDDASGLSRLTDKLEVALSIGALFDRTDDYLRLLDQGGITAIRVDPLRLGGLTPARKVALAAELRQVATYPVRLPEIGVHLCCGVLLGRVGEYVDWFASLFEGGPRFVDGQLVAPTGPGLGLALREDVAAQFRA
ncbi:MAG: mandelate racemase/muconate lactonizing enzyme family protein [Bacteroidales bacterium]|nr:mandelate racemase/muconate lactonizing enzyme family protein [Bacteroidales bacterium]